MEGNAKGSVLAADRISSVNLLPILDETPAMRRSTSSESNSTRSEPCGVIIARVAMAQIAQPGRPPLGPPLRPVLPPDPETN